MTKSELIDAIAARADLTKARAEMVVNCVFDTMTGALQDGQGIEIRGFGSFTVRPYKPYDGRNPRTGQPVPAPAGRPAPATAVPGPPQAPTVAPSSSAPSCIMWSIADLLTP